MPTLGRWISGANRVGRGALKLSFRAVGIPPSKIRERADRAKGAVKERIRRFVLLPEQLEAGASLVAPELERLSAQIAVLRQQHAAARERIGQLEATNADVVRLMEDAVARLRVLDLKQAEAIEALRARVDGGERSAAPDEAPAVAPVRRTAASGH